MTKNRIHELRRVQRKMTKYDTFEDFVQEHVTHGTLKDLESLNSLHDEFEPLPSYDLFQQVEDQRLRMEEVKEYIERVKVIQGLILTSPKPEPKTQEQLGELTKTIKNKSNIIRQKLKELEDHTKEIEENRHPSRYRMHLMQHDALRHDFVTIMTDLQMAQAEYRDQCKARICRQFEIAGKYVTEEEVEDMIEDKNWSVFAMDIQVETEQARKVLVEIEARHEDILKLEKSIVELYEMFRDLAVLVSEQGDITNRIEASVTNSKEYIRVAASKLNLARKYQTKTRKLKLLLALGFILLLLIISLVLYLCI